MAVDCRLNFGGKSIALWNLEVTNGLEQQAEIAVEGIENLLFHAEHNETLFLTLELEDVVKSSAHLQEVWLTWS